jgi:SAM-dependent methyltransferase
VRQATKGSVIRRYDTEDNAQYFRDPSSRKPRSFGERVLRYLRNDEFRKTFSCLPSHNDGVVLDIACSGGRYSYRLANSFTSVIGIDASRVALTYARNHPGCANGEVTFVECNALNLPFLPGTLDYVLCIELIHHIENTFLPGLFDGISAVLKPGGGFVFDLKNRRNPLLVRAYDRSSSDDYPLIPRTIEEIKALIEKCGFTIVRSVGVGRLGVLPTSLAPIIIVKARKDIKAIPTQTARCGRLQA